MKKYYLSAALALTLVTSMVTTSCIGSFGLTNKVLAWNHNLSNKFVNELVFVAFWIVPVYEVSALADVLVLNSIEFWSGNSVIAGTRTVEGSDGRYLVEADRTGYTVTPEQGGTAMRFDYDPADSSWSMSIDGGEAVKFLSFTSDETIVNMLAPDGTMIPVELSEEGLLAYTAIASTAYGSRMLAAR